MSVGEKKIYLLVICWKFIKIQELHVCVSSIELSQDPCKCWKIDKSFFTQPTLGHWLDLTSLPRCNSELVLCFVFHFLEP